MYVVQKYNYHLTIRACISIRLLFSLVFFSQLFPSKQTMASMLHFGNNSNTFAYNWQVWDYTGLGYTRYNARDVGKEHLGYAIIKATAIFYLYFFVSGHIFLFVFVSLRCVVENKVLCNSLLLRLQVCLFFNT